MSLAELNLQKREEEIYFFIKATYPQFLHLYIETVPNARFMIMERMINAILREGFVEREVIERKVSHSNHIELDVANGRLSIAIKERYSYNRFKLEKNPNYHHETGEVVEIIHPSFLLHLIRKMNEKETYTNFDGFQAELADSVANMGLALFFQKVTRRKLQSLNMEHGGNTILDLVNHLVKENDRLFDPSLFFEQLCVSGHFLHPCTKSKMGLSIEEIMNFSSEYDSSYQLHFVAIHKDYAYYNPKIERKSIKQFWLEQYPDLYLEFERSCKSHGHNCEDFFLLPVHPWQKKHVLPRLYKEEIENGHIISIPHPMLVKPTLSFRTVLPMTGEANYHFKLPIEIQMTSAIRTVSANSVHNGPELTLILNDILSVEQYFDQSFHIIGEEIGLRFQSKEVNELHFQDRSKNLSYLIRRNPTSLVSTEEQAIVACALFNQSPITEQTLICEIIEQFHLQQQANQSFEENIFLFFKLYVKNLLAGVIPLMSKYGIGLEGHLQNTLIVFKDWKPVKVLVRDLGGVRIDQRRLVKKGFVGSYFPGSVTINDDEVEMQNKVIHTVFQSNIGELTYHLASEYKLNEQVFWEIVSKICHDIFDQLSQDQTLQGNVDKDKEALFSKTVQTKALTLMRLTDDVTDYAYILVRNPIAN
ncbi:IucA/IucC family protein [Halalkalibacter alkalisediminis]|uniref:IucA/IucC family protein n=1 Tax=Halalkalibacter alkalisediminis TaxID=935616 RepID=A0ABV6NIL8_9BACI|nr:IucA/IucC family protein [Halalkalibacter alkalisediminis]